MSAVPIEEHMCGTFKNKTSSHHITTHSALVLFPGRPFVSSTATCDSDAGVLWQRTCEFIQMTIACVSCLLPGMATHKRTLVQQRHPLLSAFLHTAVNPAATSAFASRALWGAINESARRGVVMQGILEPFIRSRETLDRRTANRLCNHITQPCQACHGSVSHSGL